MAIGTPTSLGSTSGTANPTSLTTTATVPSGALVIILACWGFGTDRTGTLSGGGLTWATDQSNVFTSGYNYRFGIFSAPAPAGLASSTALALTASATVDGMLIAGCYVTGLDVSGTRLDIGTGAGALGTAWNSGSATTTNADDLIIGGSFLDGTSTSTPGGGATELFDFQFATNAWSMTVAYKIVAAAGSQSLSGTWGASSNHVDAFAAYKAVGGGAVSPIPNRSRMVRPRIITRSGARFTR